MKWLWDVMRSAYCRVVGHDDLHYTGYDQCVRCWRVVKNPEVMP